MLILKGFAVNKPTFRLLGCLIAGLLLYSATRADERADAQPEVRSKAQLALDQAALNDKYTFILFYKDDAAPTRNMAQAIKTSIASRSDQTTLTYVKVTDPAEKAVVARFGVSRAAMPMAMAIAPNGAITRIVGQRFTPQEIEEAFVTPTMMRAMKSLQEGKLVLVCVHPSEASSTPLAVIDFQTDPHFKDRVANVSLVANDAAETKFMNQMKLDPQSPMTHTVLLAPPGMMVGKFDSTATKDDIAAALAQAGKCCNDPNCKHNQQQQSTSKGARRTTQPPQQ